jgi:alpha-glucosidase
MLPVFVRPGSILPVAPLVQSTEERPQGNLTLRVFPGADCEGSLYQDDGTTFAYRNGGFLRMSFTCSRQPDGLSIHIGRHEGSYPAWWKQIPVEVNGLATRPTSVMINGHPAQFDAATGPLVITAGDNGNGIDILIK